MVWNTRISRLRRVEERMRAAAPGDGTRGDRVALLTQMLAAERRVLQVYESWAAMPYERRGVGWGPEASRRAYWCDSAIAARLQQQRASIDALQAELGELAAV